MNLFRAGLAVYLVALVAYTAMVIAGHGWNLLAVFFGDLLKVAWPGQFNLDFMGFLGLSGLWLAWRHHFTRAGIALGIVGFFGGMMVLAPYLILLTLRARGDLREVLLGKARAGV